VNFEPVSNDPRFAELPDSIDPRFVVETFSGLLRGDDGPLMAEFPTRAEPPSVRLERGATGEAITELASGFRIMDPPGMDETLGRDIADDAAFDEGPRAEGEESADPRFGVVGDGIEVIESFVGEGDFELRLVLAGGNDMGVIFLVGEGVRDDMGSFRGEGR